MVYRLLAPGLAFLALAADAAGVHGLAAWIVLAAVVAAAVAAFTGVSGALAGEERRLAAVTALLALVFLVLGAAAGAQAPVGRGVPALAVSTVVAALACYVLPGLVWLLEPLRSLGPRTAARSPRASRA